MKKVLSLMLVLVLVLGMSTVAFAATAKVAKDSAKHAVLSYAKSTGEIDLDDIYVQDSGSDNPTYYIDLDFTGVEVKDGKGATWASPAITESERKASKITIKTIVKKGSAAFDDVDWDDKNAQRIKFTLVDELKSNNTDGVDFEVQVYLIVDGRHWNKNGSGDDDILTFSGTLINKDITIDTDSGDYVYMGDGTIVEADEYIKEIECDLDNGVSVFAKMFNGKKYWAVSNDEATDDQELVMDKYGIDTVYNLKNVGLAAVTNYVRLNDEDSDVFVYDGDLNYLGKGNDKLPWSDTYYLAAKQLEIEDEDEPIDEEEDPSDLPEDPEDLGGDDYPDNVNDNPGTGR